MPNKDNVGRSLSITSQESYSAVIIADLVAEVQDQSSPSADRKTAVQRSNSARSEVLRSRKGGKKDETNLGFDGHQTAVDVEAGKTINGTTDITKGVILNTDHAKLGGDYLNGAGGKAIEMQDAGQGKADAKKAVDAPASFKDMSVLRRVAFAASFLPSIMFVLCFAVILPCHKKMPCIEEMWSIELNNTEISSELHFPGGGGLVFAYSSAGASPGLQGLHPDTGFPAWREDLPAPSRALHCAHLLANDSTACMVDDSAGRVHFYNAHTGDQLLSWNTTVGASAPSPAVVLPDCDGDGVSEVGVATSPSVLTLLKVLFPFPGFAVSRLQTGVRCDGTPAELVPWTTADGTDVVYRCRNGTEEHLVRITQEKWCASLKKNKGKGEIIILDTRPSGVLEKSLILPTEDGIIIWSEEEVTKIAPSGQKRWSVNIQDHSDKNRFLLYGKFNKTDSQVALFSSDISANLQITTLSSETGDRVWNRSVSNAEIGDVSLVHGSEKDFVVVVMRKVVKDLTNKAASHINEVSTSILNLLSPETVEIRAPNVTSSIGSSVTEEISFMELNGESTHLIEERKMSFSEGEAFSTKVTVVPKQGAEDKNLRVMILRKLTESAPEISSHLKRMNVANWDISISSKNQCIV